MQYALLVFAPTDRDLSGPLENAIAEVLARPSVTGWARLRAVETATTVCPAQGSALLTDGPFIDSKEYLAGLIMIDVANLDEALAVAQEFQDARTNPDEGAIEVRPVFEGTFGAA